MTEADIRGPLVNGGETGIVEIIFKDDFYPLAVLRTASPCSASFGRHASSPNEAPLADVAPTHSPKKPPMGALVNGGETGIRTLGTRESTTVFETAPFDHSGISPQLKLLDFFVPQ